MQPYDLELMLHLYVPENLYNLSDKTTVAEIVDSCVFIDSCEVKSSNQIPNDNTLGQFCNFLICNGLQ